MENYRKMDNFSNVTELEDRDYISVLQKELDGRSLKTKTLDEAFDPFYEGKNKNVFAIKYLINLEQHIGKDTAIYYIEGICKGRPFGWKAVAEIAYLCIKHSKDPLVALKSCAKINLAFKHKKLPDGSHANDGGGGILEELKKHTDKTLGDGPYASKTKGN